MEKTEENDDKHGALPATVQRGLPANQPSGQEMGPENPHGDSKTRPKDSVDRDTSVGWYHVQDIGSKVVQGDVSELETVQRPPSEQEQTLQLLQNVVDKCEKNIQAMRTSIELVQQRVVDRPAVQRFDWDPTDPILQHATHPRRHSVDRSLGAIDVKYMAASLIDGRSLGRLTELLDRQQGAIEKLKRATNTLNASKNTASPPPEESGSQVHVTDGFGDSKDAEGSGTPTPSSSDSNEGPLHSSEGDVKNDETKSRSTDEGPAQNSQFERRDVKCNQQ